MTAQIIALPVRRKASTAAQQEQALADRLGAVAAKVGVLLASDAKTARINESIRRASEAGRRVNALPDVNMFTLMARMDRLVMLLERQMGVGGVA